MKRKKMTYLGILVGMMALAFLVGANTVLTGRESGAGISAVSGKSRQAEDVGKDVGTKPEEHACEGIKSEKKSDLDRSVEEMWTIMCEHNILQYTCDECRYEMGVVKVASSLMSANREPGLMSTTMVETLSHSDSLVLTGEVKLSEGKTVHLSAPVQGVVHKVFIDIGRIVKKGDALIEIDSNEVAEAKGDYMKKEATLDLVKKTAEREAKLFKKKISAEAEVQEAQAKLSEAEVELSNSKTRLLRLGFSEAEISSLENNALANLTGMFTIRAPQGGIIMERNVNVSENIEPGKDLFLLSDLAEVWVWADLREGDIPTIAKNTNGSGTIAAEVRAGATGTMVYRGTLDVLAGTMDEQTRTLKARIIIPNPEGFLRPGMFVNIRVLIPGNNSVLTVPKVAVLADEGRSFVFVHKEGDYWIRRPVSIGKGLGEMVEVRDGLIPGQKIIADGSFLLKSDVLRAKMGAGCAD